MNMHLARTILLSLTLPLASGLYAANPDGKTIVMQGNGKGATACVACHGADGAGNASAGYPYLAGLPAQYLIHQLHSFKDGSRQNAIMKPIASQLSETEMNAVADYFSDQEHNKTATPSTTTGPGDNKGDDKGAKLAQKGKWEAGVSIFTGSACRLAKRPA